MSHEWNRSDRRPGFLVKRVQQQIRHACEDELRAAGVSLSQYAVLRALADHPGASSAALARLCFVTRQSLQDVLAGLRGAGLVTVALLATHGRSKPVVLTQAGQQRLDAADRAMRVVEERMLAGFSPDERGRLAVLLGRCAENLDAS